jgi:hypothetical protein
LARTSFCARSKAALTLFSANDRALAIASLALDGKVSAASVAFYAAPMKPKNAPRACSTFFFSKVDDLGRNPLWSVDHSCSPPAILRDVLDVTGSAGHGCSYRRNLESLLAFVSTYKQPRAKRRMLDSILGDLRSHLRACDCGSWARDNKAGAEIGMRT